MREREREKKRERERERKRERKRVITKPLYITTTADVSMCHVPVHDSM